MRGRQWTWVDAVFFGFTAAYFFSLVPYGLNLDDEGTLLYQIYRTSLGHRLYSDFHAGYTPGVYLWNAALFRVLGVNVLCVRFCLAIVNALAVYLIYALACRIGAHRWPAAAAAWSYVALIPYYDGQFFSANIPYPIWYVTVLWLLGIRLLLAWWKSASPWWLFANGVVAGVIFSFKPNSGMLAAAGYGMAVAALLEVARHGERTHLWFQRCTEVCRRLLPLAVAAGVGFVILGAGSGREVVALALPVLGFAVLAAYLPRKLRQEVSAGTAWLYGIAFVAGMGLAVAPWSIHYVRELGMMRFLRTTLFVGTNFDKFYFLPYPSFSSFGWLLIIALFAAVVLLWSMRQRLVAPTAVLAGGVVTSLLLLAVLYRHPPPMVEGVSASVTMRLRDVAFPLALATLWAGIAWCGVETWKLRRIVAARATAEGAPQRLLERVPTLVLVSASAALMHVQLYPRADFMHLVPAVPALLVIGALLLSRFTERLGLVLARRVATGRALRNAAVGVVALTIAAVTAPGWYRAAYLWRFGLVSSDALVRLESPRAPLVVEPAGGRLLRSLNETVRFVSTHSAPGEFVFTFPVLDLVSFLADRHNPTRHGYFYPGWPGHEVEAEVIDALRTRPPRLIVTLHDHPLFFATAPVYYFNLRRYIIERYDVVGQIGMFDVLAETGRSVDVEVLTEPFSERALWLAELHHSYGSSARALERVLQKWHGRRPENLAREVASLPAGAQELLVYLVRKSRSPSGAAALALLVEQQALSARAEELAIRTISEVGDSASVLPLLRLSDAVPAARAKIFGLLYNISGKVAFGSYWFSKEWRAADEHLRGLDWEQLATWADNGFEHLGLRLFAVRVMPHVASGASVPILARLVGDRHEWPELSAQAADALAALDAEGAVLPGIVRLLRFERLWTAAVLAHKWNPENAEARAALEGEMVSPSVETRTTAFWIAAGVRDGGLRHVLEAGLRDAVPEVRMAAAWGLGELGDRSAVAVLEQHLDDPDDRVQTFVRASLAKFGVVVSARTGEFECEG
ncbi:MAG: hypothetical protein KatS3mg077_0521 [Candidatus Binatia bacterium]|nr:MAG: hypothetical protein KatS3mg077_0521 [Candidatus Binatia bacterium]